MFGISYLDDTYVRYEYNGEVFEAVIADGFENTPATQYHEGVVVGVVRYHLDDAGLADGYYLWTVRTDEQVTTVGMYAAVSELRDSNGNVVFQQPNLIDVLSLTVMENVADPGVTIGVTAETVTAGSNAFNEVSIRGTVCCKNGTCGTCIGSGCPKPR